jgi:hypothetical protein
MFDMLSGQYKNLASKGRYGDTMLAHINPQEASLLQSMGGAGTVNPQTGLPEFYPYTVFQNIQRMEEQQAPPTPIGGPSIPQSVLDALPKQLETQTISTPRMGGFNQSQVVVPPPNAIPVTATQSGMGGPREVPTGEYYIPLDMPNYPKTDALGNAVPPLVAKYDASGNLQTITAQTRYAVDENYRVQPEYNLKGELVATGLVDNREGEGGGFGDFLETGLKDFAPMIALAVGANYFPSLFTAGAPAAAGGAAAPSVIGPYAAQAAGAYGGSSAAAAAAAAGNLAGIKTASGLQNALTAEALARTGITYGGNVTPANIPTSGGGYPAAPTGAPPAPDQVAGMPASEVTQLPITPPNISGAMSAGQTPFDIAPEITASTIGQMPDLSSLGGVGSAILDFAKKNPSIAGSLLGAVTSAVGAANAPKAQTSTTSIDPQIKAEYLANLERAKTTAAGLEARQIAQPGQLYSDAESKLYNLGMTPFGEADIAKFFNPYQEQVVQGALGDIERTRLMQEQANRDQATRARAFGGSRQAVVSGMTNEAALRQAATTGAQLRSAGYTQAANLGLQARPMDIAGLQTSLGLGTTRTALEQARLDALRNLGQERLAITSGGLSLQPANTGGTTSQPLYNNTAGNLLSGGLTGAYIGSLLQPKIT